MKCFFLVGYSLGGGSGRVRALNLTVPLGSGRVGSDNFGYGPGSGFSFEPRADLYHTPATGGEEKESHRANQVDALATHQLQVERTESHRANQVDALTTHTSYRWRGERDIEPIKWMRSPHTSYRWRGERS